MSERGNLTTPMVDPYEHMRPEPVRTHRAARTLGSLTLATGLLAGATLGAGKIIYDDPLAIPNSLVYEAGEVFGSSCDPMDAGDVQKMADKLESDMSKAKPTDPRVPYDVFSDASIPATAKKYNLHLADNAKGVYEDIKSITQPEYAWMAVSILNSYTQRQYGFTVDSENFGPTTKSDAADLVAQLYPIPTEIVKAVAQKDLKKVSSDANIQELSYYKNHDVKAAAEYRPKTDTINITSHNAAAFPHEFGHALRKTASREDCAFATTGDIPDFDAANPEGFVYGQDNKTWKRITLDQYAAQGAPDATEDWATTAGKIFHPHRANAEDCAYGQSTSLNRKEAVVLAAAERIVPHAGDYLSEQFAANGAC